MGGLPVVGLGPENFRQIEHRECSRADEILLELQNARPPERVHTGNRKYRYRTADWTTVIDHPFRERPYLKSCHEYLIPFISNPPPCRSPSSQGTTTTWPSLASSQLQCSSCALPPPTYYSLIKSQIWQVGLILTFEYRPHGNAMQLKPRPSHCCTALASVRREPQKDSNAGVYPTCRVDELPAYRPADTVRKRLLLSATDYGLGARWGLKGRPWRFLLRSSFVMPMH